MKLVREFLRWPDLTGRAWLVFWRDLLVFRRTWLANITFNFIEPLFYLGALGFGLGAYVQRIDGLPYINWIAPGLIASTAMWATASECTYDSFVRMNYQKSFHAIIATPVSVEEVVVGEMLFGTFKAVLYGSVILLVITALGLVSSPWMLLIPPVLVLGGLAFATLAMTWTGLVPGIDTFSYFFTLLITPMFLFGGVFFPLQGMPPVVERLAWFTPLYHLVVLVRSLALGQVSPRLLGDALWLAVFSLLWLNIPLVLMRRRLIQ